MVHSLLGKARHATRGEGGIPYIVIENALPQIYYDELARSFPADDYVANGAPLERRGVHRRSAREVIEDKRVGASWREFFAYHSSRAFYEEACAVWGDAIYDYHPRLLCTLGKPLEECTVGRRFPKKKEKTKNNAYDFVLDCQFSVNCSREKENSVRGPHLDSPYKLFAGLFYLRNDEDHCSGGDLEFFRIKNGVYPRPKPARIRGEEVERVARIRYSANLFVLFLNSPLSIHAVTLRSVCPHTRRYVNVLAECSRNLPGDFFIAPEPSAPRWYRWLRQRAVRYRG